jgi:hypothetical protein
LEAFVSSSNTSLNFENLTGLSPEIFKSKFWPDGRIFSTSGLERRWPGFEELQDTFKLSRVLPSRTRAFRAKTGSEERFWDIPAGFAEVFFHTNQFLLMTESLANGSGSNPRLAEIFNCLSENLITPDEKFRLYFAPNSFKSSRLRNEGERFVFVLEGTLEIRLGGENVNLKAGAFAFLPRKGPFEFTVNENTCWIEAGYWADLSIYLQNFLKARLMAAPAWRHPLATIKGVGISDERQYEEYRNLIINLRGALENLSTQELLENSGPKYGDTVSIDGFEINPDVELSIQSAGEVRLLRASFSRGRLPFEMKISDKYMPFFEWLIEPQVRAGPSLTKLNSIPEPVVTQIFSILVQEEILLLKETPKAV